MNCSKVYFTPVTDSNDIPSVSVKLQKLLKKSGVLDFIKKRDRVAVKIHFGEEGNAGFVKPEYASLVCEYATKKGAFPFLSDTNTLYRGRRINSEEHLETAHRHGFTKKITGADVVIPDDTKEDNCIDIHINKKFIKTAKIARIFIDSDALVAINHFKGHILTGFGGAIKNIGMGCATRQGKLMQHCDVAPVVYKDRCTGCRSCIRVCPAGAIRIEDNKSFIDVSKCIGCANCIEACPTGAMFIDMAAGDNVQMKMAEYAFAVMKGRKSAGFLNFAVKISKECDCWAQDNPRVAPDVGILASYDPVAIDKASFDLINKACGKDIFKEIHPDQNGIKQLEHAKDMGMGNMDYELIEL